MMSDIVFWDKSSLSYVRKVRIVRMFFSKNYFLDALSDFMKDNGLCFNEHFYIYDYRKQYNAVAETLKVGEAFINPGSYDLIVDGEVHNEMFHRLLSGVYYVGKILEASASGQVRGFKTVSGVSDIRLPERGTEFSAGYDFFACSDTKILPHRIVVVWIGVKAFMPKDEVLLVFNRSSNALKKGLMLANGVGVVDSDYYENKDNDGNIGFSFYNFTDEIVMIKKGEKLGQAIFTKFFFADNDTHGGKRVGGYGSTGK